MSTSRQMQREDYLALRHRFHPQHPSLIVVAESPPLSGRYFYDPSGKVTEPLFAALMEQLGCRPADKESGLLAFQEGGWLLADATYEPVNAMSNAGRDRVILRDYPLLRADLLGLDPGQKVPIVLVKANVCALLAPRLAEDGFNVLNGGQPVYFPSNGRQPDFRRQFAEIIAGCGIRAAPSAH